ncbi:hypothetical protein P691DRAFT_728154 [Macrolepiota fuliginosa MF-IS2]|uniref:Nephrocystin 3-like N-terminal domain-containing protein n=1 Tax=Macrolepiota fuliginosa MF-IS2 TaxID=1400762 RepID=A0A9P6C5F9_9AGAR|nr:hypothetical protein P691DRAFT_728154 [Macrolepiota fuliginosa MF-IS2]
MNQPQFSDNSRVMVDEVTIRSPGGSTGIQTLFSASIPEAAHDAAAREYAPRCHPGTRRNYIDEITMWGVGSKCHDRRILWMQGPAGVGKSAIAQSCAEAFGDRLGAAFFFSRPHKTNEPGHFFTSIAYQLATRYPPYRHLLDIKISEDPALVTKSIAHQFYHLLVVPLKELKESGKEISERVIIVDGLDECEGEEAQYIIVKIIANSIRDQTTPFLWVFFSRPEANLISLFGSQDIQLLCSRLELPVSRDIDHEIALFLTDKLREIQRDHKLPPSWPSGRAIEILIDLSAGLFIYAVTIVRFIGDANSLGPEEQLNTVLSLAVKHCPLFDSQHPLLELDTFYLLIMRRVPRKTLDSVLEILLLISWNQNKWNPAVIVANMLSLSATQFNTLLRPLHSVLSIGNPTLSPYQKVHVDFYHTSFLDFLCDPTRSGGFSLDQCKFNLWNRMSNKLEIYTPGECYIAHVLHILLTLWGWKRRFPFHGLLIYPAVVCCMNVCARHGSGCSLQFL